MKQVCLLMVLLSSVFALGQAGTTSKVRFGNSLPSTCRANDGNVFFLNGDGIYVCTATNTWSRAGILSFNGDSSNSQTLTDAATGTDVQFVDSGGGTHVLQVPDASTTARGVITTGAQTIAGQKTFTGNIAAPQVSANGTGESAVTTANNATTICTVSAGSQMKICTDGNIARVSVNGAPYVPLIHHIPLRKLGYVYPSGGTGTASFNVVGEGATAVNGTNSATAPTDTSPELWNQITTTTSGAMVSLTGNTTQWRTGTNIDYVDIEALAATTSERFWIGLTSASGTTNVTAVGNNDSLVTAGSFKGAAFRYSTNASDTNFMCVTSNGTTQTATSSGVAANTSTHSFEIRENGENSNWLFYIDHSLVCTMTATLPNSAGNVNLQYVRSLTTLSAATRTVGFGGLEITNDLP